MLESEYSSRRIVSICSAVVSAGAFVYFLLSEALTCWNLYIVANLIRLPFMIGGFMNNER
jgi:hypothetical protein